MGCSYCGGGFSLSGGIYDDGDCICSGCLAGMIAEADRKQQRDVKTQKRRTCPKSPAELTTETYQRYLRRGGWRFVESSFLWDVLVELQRRFPEGFTRVQELEHLAERFGRKHSRSELKAAIYILYRVGAVTQLSDTVLTTTTPPSERALSKRIDALLMEKLVKACKAHQVSVELDSAVPLLNNSYTTSQLEVLLSNARSE